MDQQDKQREASDLQLELARLRRVIKRQERDIRLLSVMSENAERLRQYNETEKKLQYLYNDLLLEFCPNMIFLFNEQLQLVICSRACEPLLRDEEERQDLTRMPLEQIFNGRLDIAWVRKIAAQNKTALEHRQPYAYDDSIAIMDAGALHVQVSISPIVDEAGAIRGTIMSINDVTELTETRDRAEEAARAKSSFLANMSHEIRTPLNAIKGLSELLALTQLDTLQRSYITSIISSSNSLINIINDVLDFSKIDANRIELIEGAYSLAGLLSEVSNVLSLRAEDKELLFLVESDAGLPAELYGDDVRVKQVLINLLSNAIKYTASGYVRFTTRMEMRDDIPWLICAVEDSGVGIREDDIKSLFEAFSRVDLHTNRSIAGTGLGLAISKRLAIAMGGDITVQSIYGKGSTFTFAIPQRIVSSEPIATVKNPGRKRVLMLGGDMRMQSIEHMLDGLGVTAHDISGPDLVLASLEGPYTHCIYDESIPRELRQTLHERWPDCVFGVLREMRNAMSVSVDFEVVLFPPLKVMDLARFLDRTVDDTHVESPLHDVIAPSHFTLKNVRLLVVDDNEINLMVASEMLRLYGAEVLCADGGEEALRLCTKQKYDIIFLDHMMPGMDGVEVAEQLHMRPGVNQHTPLVALTANVVNDMRSYYISMGMDDFLAKPIDAEELRRILYQWLPQDKISEGNTGAAGGDAFLASGELAKLDLPEIVHALDVFGMYSSDVVQEMGGDYEGYMNRLSGASTLLWPVVERTKAEYGAQSWSEFARDMSRMHTLLQDIGARSCAGRARKLSQAALEGNITFVEGDYNSLMGNMYMLNKKLQVLALMAHGMAGAGMHLGDTQYILSRLLVMRDALQAMDMDQSMALLEDVAAHSLDHDLDMVLNQVRLDLEAEDFAAAVADHAKLLTFFEEKHA